MAETKPKPVSDPPLTDVRGQVGQIRLNTETYTKHAAECFVCGEKDSERDTTEVAYARGLYKEGWRVINSDKFATIGLACPECVQTPDKDRGEE